MSYFAILSFATVCAIVLNQPLLINLLKRRVLQVQIKNKNVCFLNILLAVSVLKLICERVSPDSLVKFNTIDTFTVHPYQGREHVMGLVQASRLP